MDCGCFGAVSSAAAPERPHAMHAMQHPETKNNRREIAVVLQRLRYENLSSPCFCTRVNTHGESRRVFSSRFIMSEPVRKVEPRHQEPKTLKGSSRVER